MKELLFESPLLFRSRPTSVPADLRPLWRLGLIVLILGFSRANRSSLVRLHVLSWCCTSPEAQRPLLAFLQGQVDLAGVVVRVEPWVNNALDFAVAERLVARDNRGRVELLGHGHRALRAIQSNLDLFTDEKRFLNAAGKALTEDAVKRVFAVQE